MWIHRHPRLRTRKLRPTAKASWTTRSWQVTSLPDSLQEVSPSTMKSDALCGYWSADTKNNGEVRGMTGAVTLVCAWPHCYIGLDRANASDRSTKPLGVWCTAMNRSWQADPRWGLIDLKWINLWSVCDYVVSMYNVFVLTIVTST
jgi:hypothetical protein